MLLLFCYWSTISGYDFNWLKLASTEAETNFDGMAAAIDTFCLTLSETVSTKKYPKIWIFFRWEKNSTITTIPSLFWCFPLPQKKELQTKIRISDSVYRSAPRRHRWWNSSPKHLLWSRWHLKVEVKVKSWKYLKIRYILRPRKWVIFGDF